MTFYEAALEVLRKSGRALHYKKIIEVAIRDDLLAHVGRNPLEMMEQRLELESQKGDDAWIFQTRPGVYSLKEEVVESLNEKAEVRDSKPEKRPKAKRKKRRPIEADLDPKEEKEKKSASKIKGSFDSVADAAFAVLLQAKKEPMELDDLAEVIFNQKLVRFHTHEPDLSTETALLLDNLEKIKDGSRPRFEHHDGQWGLTDWAINSKILHNRAKIERMIQEIQQDSARELSNALTKLSADVFEMIIMQLLAAMRFKNIKVAKRSPVGEVVLSGDACCSFSSTRTGILLHNADLTLEISHLKTFKKSLKHYNAQDGVVIHIGRIGKDVGKAAKQQNLSFIDRKKLVELLFEYEIGVRRYNLPMKIIDMSFIKALS